MDSIKPVQRRLLIPLATLLLLLIGGFDATLVCMQLENLNRRSRQTLAGVPKELDASLGVQADSLADLQEVILRDEDLRSAMEAAIKIACWQLGARSSSGCVRSTVLPTSAFTVPIG